MIPVKITSVISVAQMEDFVDLSRILNACIYHFKEIVSLLFTVEDKTSKFLSNNVGQTPQSLQILFFSNALWAPSPHLSMKEVIDMLLKESESVGRSVKMLSHVQLFATP